MCVCSCLSGQWPDEHDTRSLSATAADAAIPSGDTPGADREAIPGSCVALGPPGSLEEQTCGAPPDLEYCVHTCQIDGRANQDNAACVRRPGGVIVSQFLFQSHQGTVPPNIRLPSLEMSIKTWA